METINNATMKKTIIALAFVMGIFTNAFSQASSLTVDCQNPGWLSSMINYGDQMTLESLTVTGYINAEDLKIIGSMIEKSLKSIDLSNANCVPNNSLPEGMFGLKQVYTLNKIALPKSMVDGNYCLEKIVTDTLICGSVSCHKNYVSKNLAKNIIFREGVDTIGKGVSYRKITDSYIIENVSLPNTLKCITNQSFEGCYQLQNIDLPNSVEEIGFDAFRNTRFGYKRDTLVLPPSIKRFALTAFTYPSKVYYFPEGTTYIDNTRIYAYYISSVGYEEHITPENPAVFHLRSSSPPEFHYLKDNYSSNLNISYSV